MEQIFLLFPVLLPVLSALALAGIKPLAKPTVMRIFVGAVMAVNALLVLYIVLMPTMRQDVIQLGEGLPIFFRSDEAAKFFAILCAVMFIITGIFSFEYMKHEWGEKRFFTFWLLTLGTLMGVAFAGNLLTLYLFFEMMTFLSMPLVLHSLTKEAIASALKYLFFSIAGASLALIGFFMVFTFGTSVTFTPGGVLDAAKLAGNENLMLVGTLLAIVGFGVKAGMFPLHGWLPSAHSVAPSPASAILSGVITKAGVFAVFRFVFQLVGADFIRGTFVQVAWLVLSLLSIFIGGVMAYRQPVLKRRLAYSSISQLSYIMFGMATLAAGGLLGALFHIIVHSIIKNGLFISAGAITYKTGVTEVEQLKGLGVRMPMTFWCIALFAITVVGIPPTGGFLSKWNLATGALTSDTGVFVWLGPVMLLFSALLAAGYLLPIPIRGFFPGMNSNAYKGENLKLSPLMYIPQILLAALAVGIGFFFEPIKGFFEGIISAAL